MDTFFDILPAWGLPTILTALIVLAILLIFRLMAERQDAVLRWQWPALALRGLFILLLAMILINPVKFIPKNSGTKQKLIVLLDRSKSMAVEDQSGRNRLETAVYHLQKENILKKLSTAFDLDLRLFDKEVIPAAIQDLNTVQPDGTASDLEGALIRSIADFDTTRPNAGILLVSDGRSTRGAPLDAARLAVAQAVPLWTWCLGGEVVRQDVRVETTTNEVLAFADTDLELKGQLHQVGYDRRSFKVTLLKDGVEIKHQQILPNAEGVAPVVFRLKAPAKGEHRYALRVAAQPGEADTVNNERGIFVRVVGTRVKVLLAESEPHWDTKFMVHTLRKHDRIDLTAIYRLGAEQFSAIVTRKGDFHRETTNLFPSTRESLFDYDVCILGRGCESFFNTETEAALADFVAMRGGGLIFSRGKPYNGRFTALAQLEPVVWGQGSTEVGKVDVTRSGRHTPLFNFSVSLEKWHGMSGALPLPATVTRTRGEKPLAVVLATATERPPATTEHILMAYQNFGLGRVVTLNANGLWRWAFREKAKDDQLENVYQHHWLALIQWLLAHGEFLPGADVALRTERRYYTDTESIELMILTKGLPADQYQPRLTVKGPGLDQAVSLGEDQGGQYQLRIGPFPAGIYDIVLTNNIGRPPELTSQIEVVQSTVELQNLSADPAGMRKMAELSEGRPLEWEEVARLPRITKQWHYQRQLAYTHTILWDRWWLLALGLLLLGAEWFLRRRSGLL